MVKRRTFMRLAAAGLSSALVPLVGACVEKIGQKRCAEDKPTPDEPLTPTDAWYFMAIQGAYEADLASYRLKVAGLVDRELSLSTSKLRAEFPSARESITLACVGNSPQGCLQSSSWFAGARVIDVLDAAGVASNATGAVITGLDGFVAFHSLEDLRKSPAVFAYDMGTDPEALAPLPVDHGFPLRILTPGLYGYMQPKWIDTVTLVDQGGHHEVLRRSIDYFAGKMMLASGFSLPKSGPVPAGQVDVLGYAFGDGRRIARVDVRVDDGPWTPAEIVFNDGTDDKPAHLWSLWRFDWDAEPGTHRLSSRATYADGETQIEGRAFPYSGGSIASIELSVEAPA